jgi:hypothetical protein
MILALSGQIKVMAKLKTHKATHILSRHDSHHWENLVILESRKCKQIDL